jgi:hypothetical protein
MNGDRTDSSEDWLVKAVTERVGQDLPDGKAKETPSSASSFKASPVRISFDEIYAAATKRARESADSSRESADSAIPHQKRTQQFVIGISVILAAIALKFWREAHPTPPLQLEKIHEILSGAPVRAGTEVTEIAIGTEPATSSPKADAANLDTEKAVKNIVTNFWERNSSTNSAPNNLSDEVLIEEPRQKFGSR